MTLIQAFEYERIPRSRFTSRQYDSLKHLDEIRGYGFEHPVLNWSFVGEIRCTNYVGVIQIPGLTLEILPKIDKQNSDSGRSDETSLSQKNLLYMLGFTNNLPFKERSLASLQTDSLPLLEALIGIFSKRLRLELSRGLQHDYVRREDNLNFLKGKLQIGKQLRCNPVNRTKFACEYDEFIPDNFLNQVLKQASKSLLKITRSIVHQKCLREILLILCDVSDHRFTITDFKSFKLTRNMERFKDVFEFGKLVILNKTASPKVGATKSFNLLFPMEVLYEQFIATYLRKYSQEIGLGGLKIFTQGRSSPTFLVKEKANTNQKGKNRFQLKPDIEIHDENGPVAIIDTKWKKLVADVVDSKGGVSQSDMYQLYAYATRYSCPKNILLYPARMDVTPKTYVIGNDEDVSLRCCQININRDIQRDRTAFQHELREVLLTD